MILTKAQKGDEKEIQSLYDKVTESMQQQGLNQWQIGSYPVPGMAEEDVQAGRLYVVRQDGRLICAVTVDKEQDAQYARIPWLFGVKPGCFHRLAILPEAQGRGLGKQVLDDVEEILRQQGCDSLRCDTMETNQRALRLYEGRGMRRVGTVHYPPDESRNFPCLEKPLLSLIHI